MSLDLFFYYFFYELAVIPMFLLIGIWGSTSRTVDREYATMKLVLVLSAGAVLALVGLLWLYAKGGTFDMVDLESLELARSDQLLWFPLIFVGFASLIPMWPFHSWSPAGHAAAPAAVSMLHAGVLMKLGAYGVLRIALTYFPDAAAVYLPWVGVLCCFNIVYGGLVAISHKDLKLIIGYSSSSHMGYVLLGLASATLIGFEGAVFLMFAHGIMTALAFSLIGWFYDQTHTRMVGDLGGLMRVMPFAGTCFIIASMASAGVPGFANFVSEMMVIIGAWGERFPVLEDSCRAGRVGPRDHGRLPAAGHQGRLVRRYARRVVAPQGCDVPDPEAALRHARGCAASLRLLAPADAGSC